MTDFTPSEPTLNPDNPKAREPMLNIPPLTLGIGTLLFGIFLAVTVFPRDTHTLFAAMMFIPADFTAAPLRWSYTLLSSAFLHFGWPHVLVNLFGLLAFASGIERMVGKRFLLTVFLGGAVAGVLGHWALFPHSQTPLVGASAGISACFGAVLPLIVQRDAVLRASIIFIVVNMALGLVGVPHDPTRDAPIAIAWQAHIAGFLFGEAAIFALIKYTLRRRKKRQQTQIL